MTSIKKKIRVAWRAAVTTGLALGTLGALTGTAVAAPGGNGNNLLNHVTAYTVNNGAVFCRYHRPQASVPIVSGGRASQFRNPAGKGPLRLSISGAGGYADNGFYVKLGTLGGLVGYRASGTGDSFGTNLWLDTNTANDTGNNGPFFSWNSSGCLTGLDGDISALGPASTGAGHHQGLTVNGSSQFALTCNGKYQSVSLAELKSGHCDGISASTKVAAWIGITAAAGGDLNTKITSVTRTR